MDSYHLHTYSRFYQVWLVQMFCFVFYTSWKGNEIHCGWPWKMSADTFHYNKKSVYHVLFRQEVEKETNQFNGKKMGNGTAHWNFQRTEWKDHEEGKRDRRVMLALPHGIRLLWAPSFLSTYRPSACLSLQPLSCPYPSSICHPCLSASYVVGIYPSIFKPSRYRHTLQADGIGQSLC